MRKDVSYSRFSAAPCLQAYVELLGLHSYQMYNVPTSLHSINPTHPGCRLCGDSERAGTAPNMHSTLEYGNHRAARALARVC